MSEILSKEGWFGRSLNRESVEQFIKNHFTVCWEYFYRFQIPYLTRHRKAFGDLESWNVWGSVAIVQVSSFTETLEKITREEGVTLVNKYDTEFPSKYFEDFLKYTEMSKDEFWESIDKNRSEHLWEKAQNEWKLKHQVKNI